MMATTVLILSSALAAGPGTFHSPPHLAATCPKKTPKLALVVGLRGCFGVLKLRGGSDIHVEQESVMEGSNFDPDFSPSLGRGAT